MYSGVGGGYYTACVHRYSMFPQTLMNLKMSSLSVFSSISKQWGAFTVSLILNGLAKEKNVRTKSTSVAWVFCDDEAIVAYSLPESLQAKIFFPKLVNGDRPPASKYSLTLLKVYITVYCQ